MEWQQITFDLFHQVSALLEDAKLSISLDLSKDASTIEIKNGDVRNLEYKVGFDAANGRQLETANVCLPGHTVSENVLPSRRLTLRWRFS